MATLTGHLVADTYKALLKLIDNDILTASEKQISDGFGGGSNVFIDQNGFLRAAQFKVTGGTSAQFLKGNGSLDSTSYLPAGTTTSSIAEGSNLYFTTARVLATTLAGFVAISGTVTASDTVLSSIEKIWYNIINGGGGGGGGGYVPYIGATQDLDLGTFGVIGDFVQFNTTNSAIPVGAGTMAFNNIDGTADIRLKGGNVNLPIGQQEVVRVVNVTGASLLGADYQAVYISGAVGEILQVDLALAVTGVTSAGTLGLVSETIADTLEGFITSSGLVREIDTTGDLQGEIWADGDILYLSPTVAGQITNVQPIAPNLTVIIGFVVYADAIDGKIFVKVNGNISGAGDINYVPKFDSANSIINSLIYDDGTDIAIATISPTFPADRSGLVIRANGVNSSEILMQSSINTDATIQGLAIANIFDEGGAIYQRANQHLRFGTNNLERMRLTEGGYLALGLTAPSSIIHAKDSTLYAKIIIDNNSLTGGGSFSASQDGAETAIFGVSGAWAADTTSDAAVVATRASQGIKFYTNGSTTAKGGINSVGDSFIGQLPAYYVGATNFIVQGISAAALIGITHADNSIKGIFSTLNSAVNIGSDTPHPVIFRADDIESARIASDGKWLFGTIVNDNVNIIQVNGSIIATSLKKSGGIATEFLKADGSVTSLTSSVAGITYNNTTGEFSLTVGYVIPLITAATTWDTAYNSRIASLTTTGSSGNATFISNVLNIPTITITGIGGQPISANLTSLSGLSYVSGSFVKMTGLNTFTLDTNTYYLASNPSSFITLTSLFSSVSGIAYDNTTGIFSLTVNYVIPTIASAATWDTAYSNRIASLTTTGSSGNATFISNVFNIPTITLSGIGGQPIATNLTSLSGLSYVSASFVKMTAAGTFALDTSVYLTTASASSTYQTIITNNITGTGTINELAYFNSASSIASLPVSTYPSLTEISYVKGVTSAIQPQLNTKQATVSLTTTGTSGVATFSSNTLNIPNYGSALSAYLPLSGGTLTGALSGTSATFSGNIGATNGGTIYVLQGGDFQIYNVGNSNFCQMLSTGGNFQLRTNVGAGQVNALTIASTGAATFSSGVGINGATLQTGLGAGLTIEGSVYAPLYFSNSATLRGYLAAYSGGLILNSVSSNLILNNGGSPVLIGTITASGSAILQVTGAATFSSSVFIGTGSPTSPTRTLEVSTGGDTYSRVSGNRGNSNDLHVANIEFYNSFSSILAGEVRAITGTGGTQSASGQLAFYTNNAGTYAERMRITSLGGLNINTTTTGYTLNAIRSTSTSFNTSYRGSGAFAMQIMARFIEGSTGRGVAIGYSDSGSLSGIFATQSGFGLHVWTGSAFKLKITMNLTTVGLDIPTSSSGLTAGDLWNDGGTVKIFT